MNSIRKVLCALAITAIPATLAFTAAPALADAPAVTPATNPCGAVYVQGAIACVGYYTGNFFSGTTGQTPTQEAQDAIALLLSGPATDSTGAYNPPYALDYSTILGAIPTQTDGDNTFDFGSLNLTGLTIFGAHFGNNTDGGDATNISAVWLIDFGNTTTNIVTLADGRGVSNAQIFGTDGTHLPEPSTWAMMLFGFGAIGVAMRRSRRKTQLVSQIA
jgi:hypothetical protein